MIVGTAKMPIIEIQFSTCMNVHSPLVCSYLTEFIDVLPNISKDKYIVHCTRYSHWRYNKALFEKW